MICGTGRLGLNSEWVKLENWGPCRMSCCGLPSILYQLITWFVLDSAWFAQILPYSFPLPFLFHLTLSKLARLVLSLLRPIKPSHLEALIVSFRVLQCHLTGKRAVNSILNYFCWVSTQTDSGADFPTGGCCSLCFCNRSWLRSSNSTNFASSWTTAVIHPYNSTFECSWRSCFDHLNWDC